ncbi:MAG: transcriptional regulator [Oscillospiraceae bacterium]|nr:transcriptional regulator [Oscillospiraceae bacterium]
MNVYESIMQGLTEAVEYEKGTLKANRVKLSVTPVPAFNSNDVRDIRNRLEMTQTVFAQIMGVSVKTVEAWEGGRCEPNGSARRMLSMLKNDPEIPEKYNLLVR